MIWAALDLLMKTAVVLLAGMFVVAVGLVLVALGMSMGIRRRKEQLFVWPRLPR